MFHSLFVYWFSLVENWGYIGVFFLMAMESSIFPVPSEIVMPPAAYWAAQGKMSFWGVVAAGTLGSYFGSIATYIAAHYFGRPVIRQYGRFFMLTPEKLISAEKWIQSYGTAGIFFARLLPVVRHLISIPAGILRMRILPFSVATLTGAFIWCFVLSWAGREVIGSRPEVLASPEALILACKEKLHLLVLGIVAFGALYSLMLYFKKRAHKLSKSLSTNP